MHAHFWALFYVTVGTQVVAFAADETFDVRVKARTTSRPYRLPELPGVPALRPASVGAIQATMSTLSSSYVTHVTLTTTFLSTTTVTSTSVSQTESTSHTLSQIVTASSLAPSRTSVRLIPNSSVQASASMVTSTVSTSNQVTSTSIRGSERTLVTSTTQMVDSTTTDNIATQDPQTIATPATQLHQSSSSLSSTVTLTTYTTITSLDAVSSDQNYSHSDFQPSSSKNSVKYVIIAVVAVWIVFTSCWTLSTKAGRQGGPHAGYRVALSCCRRCRCIASSPECMNFVLNALVGAGGFFKFGCEQSVFGMFSIGQFSFRHSETELLCAN